MIIMEEFFFILYLFLKKFEEKKFKLLKMKKKENRAIQKITCLKCRNDLEHIRELPDKNNSDFYEIQYKCSNCNYSIEITTHEWR